MAIGIDEPKLTCSDVAERFPGRKGQTIKTQTVKRWMNVGVRGVRLESITVGGRQYTTAEALRLFIERLSAPDHPAPQRSAERQSEQEAEAEAFLRERGLVAAK